MALLLAANALSRAAHAGLASLNMSILPDTGDARIDGLGNVSAQTYDAAGNLLARRVSPLRLILLSEMPFVAESWPRHSAGPSIDLFRNPDGVPAPRYRAFFSTP